jgi:hypothetical protein
MTIAAGGYALLGCSLITPLDGLGIASDGGGGGDAPNTGNLVPNGSFDEGQGGCGPSWGNGYAMTYTRVSPGRTGPYACQVCVQGTTTSYAINELVPIPIGAGSYYAEAWLMTPDGGVNEPNGVSVNVQYDVDAGIGGCGGIPPYCQGSMVTVPGTWTKTTASFTSNAPQSVLLDLHSYGGTPSSCFIVDDVALYAQ